MRFRELVEKLRGGHSPTCLRVFGLVKRVRKERSPKPFLHFWFC